MLHYVAITCHFRQIASGSVAISVFLFSLALITFIVYNEYAPPKGVGYILERCYSYVLAIFYLFGRWLFLSGRRHDCTNLHAGSCVNSFV